MCVCAHVCVRVCKCACVCVCVICVVVLPMPGVGWSALLAGQGEREAKLPGATTEYQLGHGKQEGGPLAMPNCMRAASVLVRAAGGER